MSEMVQRTLVRDLREHPDVETAYRERDDLGEFVEVVLATPTIPATVVEMLARQPVDIQSLDHANGHSIVLLR